jgi:hypothetical protein
MNPTLDAGKTRRLADIDTEKVDKLPAGKARDALRKKASDHESAARRRLLRISSKGRGNCRAARSRSG